MKHILFFFLSAFALCLGGCSSSTEQVENTTNLRVLSWNIWHGGHSKAHPGKSCEGAHGILKKSNADVILMIETYGCSNQVADELGYYHRLISDNLSIYSKYPIVKTYLFPDSISTFNFGGVELDVNGKRVRVFDTWLHYLPDATLVPTDKSEAEIIAWDKAGTRDDEIKKIMEVLKPFMAEADRIPMIMGGDFNIHSHLDWTEATKNLYNHNGVVVKWPVSQVMEENNFKDSFRELHPNPEKELKELGPTWNWGEKGWNDRLDRIDYIYYQGKTIQAVKSESYYEDIAASLDFYGESFFYPSDHGLVITDFELK